MSSPSSLADRVATPDATPHVFDGLVRLLLEAARREQAEERAAAAEADQPQHAS